MASLFLLVPIAFLFLALTATLFIWAVKNEQFDDLDKEGQRILFEKSKAKNEKEPSTLSDTKQQQLEQPRSENKASNKP
jgi:cbb3-type cytochrome oxidase maturation protein